MFDTHFILTTFGYLGLAGIVFAESGLFFGFFLPGDSLLFTAGFLASQGLLQIGLLLVIVFTCAVLGDSVGYYFGKKTGPKIFSRPESLLFDPEYIEETREFFERYGNKALILARFMPIIRTFTPIFAGVGTMRYKIFLTYNIAGAFLWTSTLVLGGYFLGRSVPGAEQYLHEIILAIIIISIAPSIYHIFSNQKTRERFVKKIKAGFE